MKDGMTTVELTMEEVLTTITAIREQANTHFRAGDNFAAAVLTRLQVRFEHVLWDENAVFENAPLPEELLASLGVRV